MDALVIPFKWPVSVCFCGPLQVHDYLRSKLCSLYENDCIFDKFECAWNGSDRYLWGPHVSVCFCTCDS